MLEPTSNKLMVEHAEFDEYDTHVLERFDTSAGNPIKEILHKLNLPDHRILKDGGKVLQIPQNSAFQNEDLDAYDSDCDDISLAKAILMANISSCDLDVLSEVPYSDTYPNDMINQDVQEILYSEQTHIDNFIDNEITSDSNIIPYSKYPQESQDAVIHDTNSSAPNDLLVVKKRTTSDAITAGAWGFEHTKACFLTEIIPFIKVLKDTFNAFDKTLLDEINEVQNVFNQMEAVVDQCSVDKNDLEIQIKQLRIDNDQLLNQFKSQEIMHTAVNFVDILDMSKSCVDECNKFLELETELLKKKDFIEKEVYDKLVKSYLTLEKHCISLELATQLNQEIFQKDNFGENQNAPTFNQLFEINELKAQSQEKDMVIRKLKDMIKPMSGKDSVEKVKKDIDEIELYNLGKMNFQFSTWLSVRFYKDTAIKTVNSMFHALMLARFADACFWQAKLVASSRKRHVDKRGSRAVQVGSRAVHNGLLDAGVSPHRKAELPVTEWTVESVKLIYTQHKLRLEWAFLFGNSRIVEDIMLGGQHRLMQLRLSVKRQSLSGQRVIVLLTVTNEDPDDGFLNQWREAQELSFKRKPNVRAYFFVKASENWWRQVESDTLKREDPELYK
ncbi:hypothetical protein Tco_1569825 [Tanacetum coccineum]